MAADSHCLLAIANHDESLLLMRILSLLGSHTVSWLQNDFLGGHGTDWFRKVGMASAEA